MDGASKDVERTCSGDGPGRKIKIERSLFMETFVIEVEEELSTMATQAWAEGTWIGKWYTEQEEAWLNPGSESPNVEASERSARSSDVRNT